VPSDGYADPSHLTHAFATGARALRVRIIENCEVTSIERNRRRVTALVTQAGRIGCDTVVNATGMWGAQTAALAGSDLAVSPVEHPYLVIGQIAGLPADLPTLRDPDARFYVKPEGGGWSSAAGRTAAGCRGGRSQLISALSCSRRRTTPDRGGRRSGPRHGRLDHRR